MAGVFLALVLVFAAFGAASSGYLVWTCWPRHNVSGGQTDRFALALCVLLLELRAAVVAVAGGLVPHGESEARFLSAAVLLVVALLLIVRLRDERKR